MIIINQKKDEIVNFDTINFIDIMPTDDGRFEVDANFAHCVTELGFYQSEERAKEVLREIKSIYYLTQMYKDNAESLKTRITIMNELKSMNQNLYYYEMPEE